LRTWRHYLEGSDFAVLCETDHRPLQHFLTQPQLSGRQVRWQTFLSEYNLQIAYVPGKTSTFADGLSRRPDLRLLMIGAVAPYHPWLKRVVAAYQRDPVVLDVLQRAKTQKADMFDVVSGVLYDVYDARYRVYVPNDASLRAALEQRSHF
jgi:RNase H-like domain found in reverse transcriptase